MTTHHVDFTDSRNDDIECDYRATYTVTPAPCDENPISGIGPGIRRGDPELTVDSVVLTTVDGTNSNGFQLAGYAIDPDDPVVITECEEHWAEQAREMG